MLTGFFYLNGKSQFTKTPVSMWTWPECVSREGNQSPVVLWCCCSPQQWVNKEHNRSWTASVVQSESVILNILDPSSPPAGLWPGQSVDKVWCEIKKQKRLPGACRHQTTVSAVMLRDGIRFDRKTPGFFHFYINNDVKAIVPKRFIIPAIPQTLDCHSPVWNVKSFCCSQLWSVFDN